MKANQNEQPNGVKEIARRAKVSIATVDRVIHNRSGVSAKTRTRIEKIIQELNYQPNIIASRLASRKVLNFAILIPSVSAETAFWAAPLAGIQQAEDEIKQMGIKVDRYFFDLNSKTSFTKQTKQILKSKVDGILLAPSFIEESIAFTDALKEKNIPYVFINSDIPNRESLCYIGPDLFHSGYLSAHVINYCIQPRDKILVVNVSHEIENHHHLLRKEEGFRSYFKDNEKRIVKIDIRQTNDRSVEKKVAEALDNTPNIKAIFVTNSRVANVAHYLESKGRKGILLVGYDFLPENIAYLQRSVIDFLICQKPQEQGYRGIMALYQHLVMAAPVEKVSFMPIDIITRENYAYYKN
ncbi:substrate-binding domain-containing protein [Chitinophaga sp. YIM B06452]|uniref:LacI family DNA-binding transcriptional regulator n=1 Tax=Chitinophaga sp. YIM B06452 TaxID=3082158 RepID=UPI0031FEC545